MKVVQGKVCTVQPGLFFTLSSNWVKRAGSVARTYVFCLPGARHNLPNAAIALSMLRYSASRLRTRHLATDLSGGLVLAQALIDHLAQQIVFGPGEKLDVGDKLRAHPMHAA